MNPTPSDTSINYARASVQAMHGYVPGEQPKTTNVVKLNTNENPYPPSASVFSALSSPNDFDLNRYPAPFADSVCAAAADVTGLPANWVLAGNGSDDLLTIIVRTFVDQHGCLACFDPSYSLYPILADIQGAKCIKIPLTTDFELPAPDSHETDDASLLFIARPNAPTGTAFPVTDVARWCATFAGVVVIDEAYVDFADDNCIELVRQYDNVVVTRTLSKGYSMAAVRLGFACAQPSLLASMAKVKDSYNVNALTQTAAVAALRDQAHMRTNVDRVKVTRSRICAELKCLGFDVVPSSANFLFAKPPQPAIDILNALREKGILVRHFDAPRVRDYLRITIGTDNEMERFLDAIRAVIADNGA